MTDQGDLRAIPGGRPVVGELRAAETNQFAVLFESVLVDRELSRTRERGEERFEFRAVELFVEQVPEQTPRRLIVLAPPYTGLSFSAGNSHRRHGFKTSEERIEVAGTG